MKNRITVMSKNDTLYFYMMHKGEKMYLFSQKYSKGVYEFFRNGRSESEVKAYKQWNRNPRLDKTIEKIPMYIHFALREAA